MLKEQLHSKNNFDIIRLIAATIVIVSHGYGFANLKEPLKSLTHDLDWGREGVFVFFLISGFLIAKSWVNRPYILLYLSNRVLRIFPGLFVVLLLSVFVVGPIFTTTSIQAYFSNVNTYKYFFNLTLLKTVLTLPGTFIVNGKENMVNAPLWTLIFEFLMYIIVIVYGLAGLLTVKSKRIYLFLALYFLMLGLMIMRVDTNIYILKINARNFIDFYVYFFTGTIFLLFNKSIVLKWYYLIPLIIFWALSIDTPAFCISNLLLVGFIVFFVGFNFPHFGGYITKHGDFSYGMYLYGFVIQNITLQIFGSDINVYLKTLISIALTAPFAFLSWNLVESKAIMLKDKVTVFLKERDLMF